MQIEFGAAVFGSGGQRLGEVDGLVVNAGTKRARQVLVDAGLLDTTKQMVDVTAITRSDGEGLHLDAPAAATDEQSPVLDSEEIAFPERVQEPTTFIPAAGVGGPVYADTPTVPGEYPDDDSFFDLAPLDPPPVEIESNLGENEVILGKNTHAVSSDHHELGRVVVLELGDREVVETVTVLEGMILKKRVTFSLPDIDEFGTDKIHLTLSRAEAEAR